MIGSSQDNVQSQERVSCYFVFIFLKEKKIFPQALQESLIVQHFIKCPSLSHTLEGITVAGLNKHLSLLRLGGRPPHIKPQMGVLFPRKKGWNSCSEDTQRWLLPGRICNVFTTKYQDFWRSTEQLNTWRLSRLLYIVPILWNTSFCIPMPHHLDSSCSRYLVGLLKWLHPETQSLPET